MKLNVETRAIESHGIQSKKNYTIAANAKAFKILSSNLYRNKIKAIVRELGCNAYDAHVAIGQPELPFEIHLPNYLEPHFSVKDFGPGLDQDSIEEIYTTYFLSTKAESNDYIGALGLGSKSPFSYVDSYTTVSRFNGKIYTYVAALDECGQPCLNLLNTQETDEPNGLEVIVPINNVDFSLFAKEVNEIFRWFPVKPITNMNINYPNNEKFVEGTNWYGISKDFCSSNSIVMGNIAYPLDQYQISHKFLNSFKNSGKSFVIQANLGDCDIMPGREDLSYDKTTIAWIFNRLDEVQKEYEAVVAEQIKNAKNLKHAHILYQGLVSKFDAKFETVFKYKDYVINSNYPIFNLKEYKDLRVIEYSESKARYKSKLYQVNSYDFHQFPMPTHNVVFAFDDCTKGNKGKFFNKRKKNSSAISYYIIQGATDETKQKIIDYFSGYEFEDVSSWEKPYRAPRQKSIKIQVDKDLCLKYDSYSKKFVSTMVDFSVGGVYFTKRPTKYSIVSQDKILTPSCFDEMNDMFFKDIQIIYPRKTVMKNLNKNWRHYADVLQEKIEEYFKEPKHVLEYNLSHKTIGYDDNLVLKALEYCNVDSNHFILQAKSILNLKKYTHFYNEISNMKNVWNINIPVTDKNNALDDFMKKIYGHYPLIKYIRNATTKEITDYIKLCDFQRGI